MEGLAPHDSHGEENNPDSAPSSQPSTPSLDFNHSLGNLTFNTVDTDSRHLPDIDGFLFATPPLPWRGHNRVSGYDPSIQQLSGSSLAFLDAAPAEGSSATSSLPPTQPCNEYIQENIDADAIGIFKKRLTCNLDGKTFSRSSDLNRHAQQAHPEICPPPTTFECPEPACPRHSKAFARKDKWHDHNKKHHHGTYMPIVRQCRQEPTISTGRSLKNCVNANLNQPSYGTLAATLSSGMGVSVNAIPIDTQVPDTDEFEEDDWLSTHSLHPRGVSRTRPAAPTIHCRNSIVHLEQYLRVSRAVDSGVPEPLAPLSRGAPTEGSSQIPAINTCPAHQYKPYETKPFSAVTGRTTTQPGSRQHRERMVNHPMNAHLRGPGATTSTSDMAAGDRRPFRGSEASRLRTPRDSENRKPNPKRKELSEADENSRRPNSRQRTRNSITVMSIDHHFQQAPAQSPTSSVTVNAMTRVQQPSFQQQQQNPSLGIMDLPAMHLSPITLHDSTPGELNQRTLVPLSAQPVNGYLSSSRSQIGSTSTDLEFDLDFPEPHGDQRNITSTLPSSSTLSAAVPRYPPAGTNEHSIHGRGSQYVVSQSVFNQITRSPVIEMLDLSMDAPATPRMNLEINVPFPTPVQTPHPKAASGIGQGSEGAATVEKSQGDLIPEGLPDVHEWLDDYILFDE